MTLLIAAAQMASRGGIPAENLEKAAEFAFRAAAEGASIVCFPEQFLTGWSPVCPPQEEDPDGPTVTALCRLARENGIAVLGSFTERHPGRPRNAAVAIGAGGEVLARYAKMHLFSPGGEDRYYSPGESAATFLVEGMAFGIAVCYDLRFPELFRVYADLGAECVLVPAAWPCSRIRHWELFIAVRALENQYYVAGINAAGGESDRAYCGNSLIADPDGETVCRGGAGEELLFARLDPGSIVRARERIPAQKDRKRDLYHKLL